MPQKLSSLSPNKTVETKEVIVTKEYNSDYYGGGWGWLGALILWFIIFVVLFWLIFYSLKPNFVLEPGSTTVDTAKVLLSAVIAALILVIVIWLIMAAIKSTKNNRYVKCC